MATFTTLAWQNENLLRNYPFSSDTGLSGVIVDASFIQFDGFIPKLRYLALYDDSADVCITFDTGDQIVTASAEDKYVTFYDGTRYLGRVVFGGSKQQLFNEYQGRQLPVNAAFVPTLVKSIPSGDAVYTFDGLFGNVLLSRTVDDTCVFYNVNTELNSITFNAVSNHRYDASRAVNALKQINLVKPVKNNIFIADNDVVKVINTSNAGLMLSLVGGTTPTTNLLPTTLAA